MTLINDVNFKASFVFSNTKELDGVSCKNVIYFSNDTNLANYTNWTFDKDTVWDEFYYA